MKNLIIKYLSDKITEKELSELTEWLKNKNNQKIFNQYIGDEYKINLLLSKVDSELDYQKVKQAIETKEPKIRYLSKSWFKYAAILVLLLGVGYMLKMTMLNSSNVLIIKDEPITLTLHDGSVQTLDVEKVEQLFDDNGNVVIEKNKDKLYYSNDSGVEEVVFNTLKIPYGKRFELTLSDGTNVSLNSGTTIKYPTKFIKGKNRQVYLSGEAYFDVAHDEDHPFIVNAEALNVQVLGTEFNVSSYQDDFITNVVLVKGKVSLSEEDDAEKVNSVVILPGTKGVFNKELGSIETSTVNTDLYTAWMHGELVFRNTSFNDILKKIERHYNVKVINKNKALSKEVFNARFNNQPIDSVLSYLNDSYNIKYKIDEGQLIIK
ncbi:FecR family protein [Aestuariibaculum suncheonense]|uniref:DUF4974 domain-containing protein n=1 Tax=Aestuariibaculum suncheonense TaxID=1028745 RepID=A0A8J6UGX8_9FLAO|nr:FecR domain-containing protein [Aestuariibaculum suncheonense]MBD0835439.1 DUF4974 domain-containing protein [Aestuariibaculum suncheonense]